MEYALPVLRSALLRDNSNTIITFCETTILRASSNDHDWWPPPHPPPTNCSSLTFSSTTWPVRCWGPSSLLARHSAAMAWGEGGGGGGGGGMEWA